MPAQRLYNRLLNGLTAGDPNEVAQSIAYAVQEEIARGINAGSSELVIFDAVCSKYGSLINAWIGLYGSTALISQVAVAGKPVAPKRVTI